MQVQSNAHEVVRAVLETDYSAVVDSIMIAREKYAGNEAVIAVAFDDLNGVQRRGDLALRKDSGEMWRPSGGSMGSARPTADHDVWMTWGGWSGDSRKMAVLGGWVADPDAVTAEPRTP